MAQNDLELLRQRFRDQLSDISDETWPAGEKDDLLTWAVRRLATRFYRPLDPRAATQTVTLVASTYFYTLDTNIVKVHRVDWKSSQSDELGPIDGSAWEVVGDPLAGGLKLHVSPTIVEQGGTLYLNAYGRYTLPNQTASATVLATAIPDDLVALVLALARAEAYRRILVDRVRFRQWINVNQVQNVSVNELMQMVNEADAAAEREWVVLRRWQKPVPGRQ